MANYQYYQSGGPWQNTWGTNAYQFQAPPVPTYVPQSSWGGADYYNAHYGGQADSNYFDYIWSKVRSVVGADAASRGEAEHWHRRVYSGMVQLDQLMPREIGAAAGWETLRLWQSHNAFYASALSGDSGREREAIIGLAIAEAARLWQYVGRPLDKYGRREAGEVAAATASRIWTKMYDYNNPYEPYNDGSTWGDSSRYSDDGLGRRGRRSSFSNLGGSNYGGSNYSSVSPYGTAAPIAIPGSVSPYGGYGGTGYGGGYAYSGSPYGGGYGGMATSPYTTGQYLTANPYMGGVSAPMGYGQQSMGYPGSVVIHTGSGSGSGRRHRSSSRHRHHHHRSRSNSSVGYVPTAYSAGGYR